MGNVTYEKGEREGSAGTPGVAKREAVEDKIVLTLSDFEAGKYDRKLAHKNALADLIRDFHLGRPCVTASVARVVGYTDAVGTEATNAKLRFDRADGVSGFLTGLCQRINPDYKGAEKVEAASPGTYLDPDNTTAAGRAANRAVRVELIRVPMDPYFEVNKAPELFNKERDTCGVVNAETWQGGEFTLGALTIKGRKTWASRTLPMWERGIVYYNTNLKPLTQFLNQIVIHHTSNGESLDKNEQNERERGFAAIGYHFAVSMSGQIFEGRPLEVMGSHAGEGLKPGPMNDPDWGAIGIVLLGDFHGEWTNAWSPDQPTQAMLDSLTNLIRTLKDQYIITKLLMHREVVRGGKPTVCPGDVMVPHIEKIRKDLGLAP